MRRKSSMQLVESKAVLDFWRNYRVNCNEGTAREKRHTCHGRQKERSGVRRGNKTEQPKPEQKQQGSHDNLFFNFSFFIFANRLSNICFVSVVKQKSSKYREKNMDKYDLSVSFSLF